MNGGNSAQQLTGRARRVRLGHGVAARAPLDGILNAALDRHAVHEEPAFPANQHDVTGANSILPHAFYREDVSRPD